MNNTPQPSSIELDPDMRDVSRQLLEAREQIQRWKIIETSCINMLKTKLENHTAATWQGRTCYTYTPIKSTVLDQTRLKKDHPNIAAAYATIRESRPFRINEDTLHLALTGSVNQ